MKLAKLSSRIFGVLGMILLVGSILLCLLVHSADPIRGDLSVLETKAVSMLDAVCRGDYPAAQAELYGGPDLGLDREPGGEHAAAIWEAFQKSLSYELTGEVTVEGSDVTQNVTIRHLEIPSVTEAMQTHFVALIQQRIDQAEEMSEVYDETGSIREDLVAELTAQALEQAISEAQPQRSDLTLTYVYQDGCWQISPDQALIRAITGGLAG